VNTPHRFATAIALTATLIGIAGCQTSQPSPAAYSPPPTPIQACLAEVQTRFRDCNTQALFRGMYTRESGLMQICEDRKDTQTDRCYARFGR
jgi:hypothetical protein